MSKLFSIIIPMYQAEKTIRACIASVIQTLPDSEREIIVVNDGSTDNGPAIVERIAKKHNDVKLISQENLGVAAARNSGLKAATGEYVFFLDSDDTLASGSESAFRRASDQKVDVCVFSYNVVDVKTGQKNSCSQRDEMLLNSAPNKAFSLHDAPELLFLTAYPWNKLYSRHFLLQNDIIFPPYRLQEDVEFHALSLTKARTLSVINIPVINYSVGSDTCASAVNDDKRLLCIEALAVCDEKLSTQPRGIRQCWEAFVLDLLLYYSDYCTGAVSTQFEETADRYLQRMSTEDRWFALHLLRKTGLGRTARKLQKKILQHILDRDIEKYQSDSAPLLSIVIPVYNTEKFIGQTIECVVNQTLASRFYEVIIVDDVSTDNSLAVCQSYAAQHPNLRVIELPAHTPGGCAAASNVGIDESRGKYIGFMDSDDLVEKDAFEKMLYTALENNSDLVISGFSEFHSNSYLRSTPYDNGTWCTTLDLFFSNKPLFQSFLIATCSCVPWRKIYKKDFLEKFGIRYPVGDYFFEDNPLHWFVCSMTKSIHLLDEYFFAHRLNRIGQTMMGSIERSFAIKDHATSILTFLQKNNRFVEYKIEFLHWFCSQSRWVLDPMIKLNRHSPLISEYLAYTYNLLKNYNREEMRQWRKEFYVLRGQYMFFSSLKKSVSLKRAIFCANVLQALQEFYWDIRKYLRKAKSCLISRVDF